MKMNSQHQVWSLWRWEVILPGKPSYWEVQYNCARFGRQCFGTASLMKIRGGSRVTGPDGLRHRRWQIWVRTEGHPVNDQTYVNHIRLVWARFFAKASGTVIEFSAKLEAGPVDGRPPDQLIMLPWRI